LARAAGGGIWHNICSKGDFSTLLKIGKYLLPQKENRNKNPYSKYGITIADYENMMSAQNTRCKICGVRFGDYPATLTKPCVDHNHKTKKVRGILCTLCNTGVGMFRDSADRLAKAAIYIREQGSRLDP
jgi:Recombination endonuclease VII